MTRMRQYLSQQAVVLIKRDYMNTLNVPVPNHHLRSRSLNQFIFFCSYIIKSQLNLSFKISFPHMGYFS